MLVSTLSVNVIIEFTSESTEPIFTHAATVIPSLPPNVVLNSTSVISGGNDKGALHCGNNGGDDGGGGLGATAGGVGAFAHDGTIESKSGNLTG